jgi:signal peptidase I
MTDPRAEPPAPVAATAADAAPPRRPGKSLLRECFEALVVALVVTLFLRAFVVQAFQIPSVSMEPSLLVGDRLFVDKVVFSPSLGPLESALLAKRPVSRGDVVVFKYPADPSRNFVKRVVALPGETVEVRDRVVLVGGQPLAEPYARFGDERLPAEHPDLGLRGERQRWGPRVVPDGHVFVLGDNRDRSHDSRYWGFLALDQVEGRPLVVYWSIDTEAPALLAAGLGRPRWERLFHAVR